MVKIGLNTDREIKEEIRRPEIINKKLIKKQNEI